MTWSEMEQFAEERSNRKPTREHFVIIAGRLLTFPHSCTIFINREKYGSWQGITLPSPM
jgi:hypothetical protein